MICIINNPTMIYKFYSLFILIYIFQNTAFLNFYKKKTYNLFKTKIYFFLVIDIKYKYKIDYYLIIKKFNYVNHFLKL